MRRYDSVKHRDKPQNRKENLTYILCLALGWAVLLSFILSAGCTSKPSKINNLPEYNRADSFVSDPGKGPYIVRLTDEKGRFFCTASIISKKYLLTAAHCLEDNKTALLEDAYGKALNIKAKYAASSEKADYALMTGDFSNLASARVIYTTAEVLVQMNSTLITCGFPYGGKLFCIYFNARSPYYFKFQGSAFLFPGMSGGPVFNAQGDIVAINSMATEKDAVVAPIIEIFANLDVKVSE